MQQNTYKTTIHGQKSLNLNSITLRGFRTGTHQPENDNVCYCELYTSSASMTYKIEPATKINGTQHFLNKHHHNAPKPKLH